MIDRIDYYDDMTKNEVLADLRIARERLSRLESQFRDTLSQEQKVLETRIHGEHGHIRMGESALRDIREDHDAALKSLDDNPDYQDMAECNSMLYGVEPYACIPAWGR